VAVQHLVTPGGIRLACDVAGDTADPPLILLHGLGEGRVSWAPVIGPLATRHRVFALDLRGHGDSDWPGTYSFQAMSDDVIGALDQLGLATATVIGHSMGGVVAYLAAIQRPARVGRLIIEDAPPPYVRDPAIPGRPAEPLPFDWPVVPAIKTQASVHDQAMWDGLCAITAPTLVIGGGPGSTIPQDKIAEVAVRIPRCDLVTIAAGHHVHAARPAEFAEVVLRWLGR
jgi:pimeloyl-ACP methyl ester carboxylesterase